MSSSEDNECVELTLTPPQMQEATTAVIVNMLPPKSKEKYLKAYENFVQWKNERKSKSLSENVFLAYFDELAKKVKPPTLWNTYSMLKCTVLRKHNVHLKQYANLTSMLKRQSDGYECKKSKVFTASNLNMFLFEAPDSAYLDLKVVLIFGIFGACRCNEITNITVQDVENRDGVIIVTLCDTKTMIDRTFSIRDESVGIVEKYIALRPKDIKSDRFFLSYKNNKCTKKVIGRHKIAAIPKAIATYLKLPNPGNYTGHCFRRTSATLLADTDMVSCSMSGCDVTKKYNPQNRTFHRFPLEAELRAKWIRIINRPKFTPFKNSTICSKHFDESCFKRRTPRRMLRRDSIPTLFVPPPSKLVRSTETGSVAKSRPSSHTAHQTLQHVDVEAIETAQSDTDDSCDSSATISVTGDEWLPRGDVCRCCVSRAGVWDLTATYVGRDQKREDLHEMLLDCYGIKLSNIVELGGPSRLVCERCAESLRRALKFKKQVLEAEKKFQAFYGKSDEDAEIKEEYVDDRFESHENEISEYASIEVKVEEESMEPENEETISQAPVEDISEPTSTEVTNYKVTNPKKRSIVSNSEKSDITGDASPMRTSSSQENMKEISYRNKNIQIISYCPENDDFCTEIPKDKRRTKLKTQSISRGYRTDEIDTANSTDINQSLLQIGASNLKLPTARAKVNVYASNGRKFGEPSVRPSKLFKVMHQNQ